MVLATLWPAARPSHAFDAARMQSAARRVGPAAVAVLASLQSFLAQARRMEPPQRLVAVNEFINRRIAYATDLELWGQEDYWASPLEALARGRGDCEDYAIAKYASLLAAGTPSSSLRLAYVWARTPPTRDDPQPKVFAHMVLAYQVGGDDEPMILDNLHAEVLPSSARPDLTPVYSFSDDGLWQGNGKVRVGDAQARLVRWREVLIKLHDEGFD